MPGLHLTAIHQLIVSATSSLSVNSFAYFEINLLCPTKIVKKKDKKILNEINKIAQLGKGVAQLDGKMIDAASARMAENVVRAAAAIAAKS